LDLSTALSTSGTPGALPPEPPTGVIGRTEELSTLKTLLSGSRVAPVWLTGYEGIGKTTLVCQLARDLIHEGRFERIVYTSLGRSGLPEATLYDLGQCLIGPWFKLASDALPQIEEALRKTPTLIIWDDAGQVLYGGSMAMEQQDLVYWYQTAGRVAAQGSSVLCIISDGIDLPPSARRLAGVREHRLATMSDEQALELCLAMDRAAHRETDSASWNQVVGWLGGHPLALRSLSAARQGASLESTVSALAEQAPGLATGEGRYRNRAADLALDRLATAIPADLAEHLPDLAVFASGFVQNLGPEIMGLTRELWVEQSGLLAEAGLVWDEPLATLTIPAVRFHPALVRWAGQRLTAARRSDVCLAHYGHYSGFASWVVKSAPRLRDAGPKLFYQDIGNVRLGLYRILEAGDVSLSVSYIQLYNALLMELGFERESSRATDTVTKATQSLLPEEGPWTRAGVELALKQSEAVLASGDTQKAGALLSQLAMHFERPDGVDYKGTEATLDRVRVLVDLAGALRASKHFDVAVRSLDQAVELLDPFESDADTRTRRAEIYSQLLDLHLQTGQLDEANSAFHRGLSALGDQDSPQLLGSLHTRGAVLAIRKNDPEGAREELAQASAIMAADGDLAGLASVEGRLATLALRPPADVPGAMTHMDRAIGYAHEAGQWLVEAQLHSQAAPVAMQGQLPELSEQHLAEAASLYEANAASGLLTVARASLAEFYLRRSRPDEAQREADQALAAGEASGQGIPWELYLLLQKIANSRNDEDAAARWRLLTQSSYAHSPAAATTVARWTPLIDALAKASLGEALDTDAERMLESMEDTPQWSALGRTLWRVLSGERGAELCGPLDHVDALVVRTLLDRIGRPSAEGAPSAT
jgi:tetratricopeptide (TPR) repeat protein